MVALLMRNGNGKPGNVTLCELPPPLVAMVSATGYSKGIGGRELPSPPPAMTHTLCLDNCQTFEFRPHAQGVAVTRRAPQPVRTRKGYAAGQLKITGQFQMTREEARKFWIRLIKDGAFRA